jgi:hypothetical protein
MFLYIRKIRVIIGHIIPITECSIELIQNLVEEKYISEKIRFRKVYTSINVAFAFVQLTVITNVEYPERTSKKDRVILR